MDPLGRRGPDRAAALAQYRRRAPHYDEELLLFEPIRRQAIAALELAPGQCVLDVGCGTGLSFEGLLRGIGERGHVIGIEQSPEMLDRARERVRCRHWRNVELLCAPAAAAPLHLRADAALFHFTHDILRDEAAIANVLAHLKPGARVVATGLRWAPAWLWPANAFVLLAALYSVTDLEGLAHAWDKLAEQLPELQVRDTFMGAIFIARGRVRAP
jgi:demethylmenaquinone methyltransferase/2-methoxy-6-polyprenyl-1,4-benzoquinol methylase